MKVAFLHFEYPFGGGEMVTSNLSEYFTPVGCEVLVLACKFSGSENENIKFVTLPYEHKINHKTNIDFMIDFINTNQIDILVLPGVYLKEIQRLKSHISAKIVFALHSMPMWEATNKVLVAQAKSSVSILKKLEWCFFQKIKYQFFKTHRSSILKLYKKTFSIVDAYVVLCDAYKEDMETILGEKSSSKLFVISNSVKQHKDVSVYSKIKELLYVGRLSYADKRIDRLILVWKRLMSSFPDWSLRIVGDGPDAERLKDLVLSEAIERVYFEGYHKDVDKYYSSSPIICMTSSFEGWPLTLGEAQAYGVVPVAFNCSAGVEDILSPNGINGILVPPFDLDTYAKELERLMNNDDERIKMAKAALAKSKEYSLDVVGKKWLDLFSSLILK